MPQINEELREKLRNMESLFKFFIDRNKENLCHSERDNEVMDELEYFVDKCKIYVFDEENNNI